ncbi:hypothetical protein JCM3770_004972 [Rhodotorula araucariae]
MKSLSLGAVSLTAALSFAVQGVVAGASVNPTDLPHTSEKGQYGYNDCTKFGDSASAKCQTLIMEGLEDFCLYAPPQKATIGDSERYEVAWCTKAGHGARLIPKDTLKGVHVIKTSRYIQWSGQGDLTKLNIPKGDQGGELDPHGADGNGNPIGAVVLTSQFTGKLQQVKEWHSFISSNEFCVRICNPADPDAWKWCNHIYDTEGCYWNDPGNYGTGFDTCKADVVAMAPGEYKLKNGATSTWRHGQLPTPTAQKPAKSSQCTKVATITAASYPRVVTTTTKKAVATTTKKATTTTKKVTTTTKKAVATTKKTTTTKKAAAKTTTTKKAAAKTTTTKKAATKTTTTKKTAAKTSTAKNVSSTKA